MKQYDPSIKRERPVSDLLNEFRDFLKKCGLPDELCDKYVWYIDEICADMGLTPVAVAAHETGYSIDDLIGLYEHGAKKAENDALNGDPLEALWKFRFFLVVRSLLRSENVRGEETRRGGVSPDAAGAPILLRAWIGVNESSAAEQAGVIKIKGRECGILFYRGHGSEPQSREIAKRLNDRNYYALLGLLYENLEILNQDWAYYKNIRSLITTEGRIVVNAYSFCGAEFDGSKDDRCLVELFDGPDKQRVEAANAALRKIFEAIVAQPD